MSTRKPRAGGSTAARAYGLARYRDPNDPEFLAARSEAVYAISRDKIAAIVDAAPALTDAQRAQLAALILTPRTDK
jgi:hypothetical protein